MMLPARPMRLLLAVLLLLAGLGLLAARRFLARPASAPFEPPLARIELERGGRALAFARGADGAWRATPPGDLADADAVERLKEGLESLTLGDVVAGRDAAAAYGLGPSDALLVRAWRETSGRPAELLLGRPALAGSLHALEPDGRSVRLARGPDPALLARTPDAWRERRLLPGGCPAGAAVREAGRPARRVPAGDPLCALAAEGFEPESSTPYGGFERPYLVIEPDGGPTVRVGARLSRRERAAAVDGRPGMMRVALDGAP